jgi:hypothetical protein
MIMKIDIEYILTHIVFKILVAVVMAIPVYLAVEMGISLNNYTVPVVTAIAAVVSYIMVLNSGIFDLY